MPHPIGIDLGTTNSVACVFIRGVAQTIPVDGRTTMPSAMSVRPDGTVLVGQAAKSRSLLEPEQSVTSAKRFIGDGKTTWEICDRVYTPIEVSAMVLNRLKSAAEEHLKEPVRDAVITVPAYFNNNQKRDTKLAGEAAGFHVLQLLPEPTAAAISYGLDKGKDQTLLVYDLGGGTFDVSVLRVKGNRFSVLAVDGDFNLGGDDFDLLIADYLIEALKKRSRSDVGALKGILRRRRKQGETAMPPELLVARQKLKGAAEKAKIELAEADEAQVTIPDILGTSLDETITLETYNGLIAPLVERTIAKVNDVLQAAKLTAGDIDRVILVGGSTRNRLVKERVAAAVKEPWIAERVDEVVAQGAAIVASYQYAPEEDLTPIEFTNVTPFSLGVRASKGKETDIFQMLIPRNTAVPSAMELEFTTLRANQKSVDVSVFQGEQTRCKENTFIGGFRLQGIPPSPAGQPKILVRFGMDDSDLLTVTATCSNLRTEQTLDVNLVSREDETPEAMPQADIIFLIDTSGSMSAELDGVKRSCLDFANRVVAAGIDCRLGLVDFALSDKYNWEVFGPMEPSQFPASIAKLRIGRIGGGGCYIGATSTIPVIRAYVKAFPTSERLRVGILISDEVGNDARAIQQIIDDLQQGQICMHVLGVRKSCHERIAAETGGRFWDIVASRGHADLSELLDAIAVEITNLALK